MSTINYWELGYYGLGWSPFYWGSPYHGGKQCCTRTEGPVYRCHRTAKNQGIGFGKEGAFGTVQQRVGNIGKKKKARIKRVCRFWKILEAYPPARPVKLKKPPIQQHTIGHELNQVAFSVIQSGLRFPYLSLTLFYRVIPIPECVPASPVTSF